MKKTADLINKTSILRRKDLSVGTTSTRTLESAASEDGTMADTEIRISSFIRL